MSTKRKGLLTVSAEWARHLRPYGKREFWRGERQAESVLARQETTAILQDADEPTALESLLQIVDELDPTVRSLDLLVPDKLIFTGQAIPHDAAMALLLDRLLGRGLFPQGYVQQARGRLYQYSAE